MPPVDGNRLPVLLRSRVLRCSVSTLGGRTSSLSFERGRILDSVYGPSQSDGVPSPVSRSYAVPGVGFERGHQSSLLGSSPCPATVGMEKPQSLSPDRGISRERLGSFIGSQGTEGRQGCYCTLVRLVSGQRGKDRCRRRPCSGSHVPEWTSGQTRLCPRCWRSAYFRTLDGDG